ncbi:replication-relaxation family protein [Enterococcus sp. AZ192]|uniref:replication-relaxation family protein n=1 Tax=unclassified Enterococcus TaxID=2608891 RepID=UPI003D2D49EC
MNEENKKRRSKNELKLIAKKLDEREMEILEHLHKVKFATSDQLRRVFFTENKNETAGLRACNRTTKRMKELGIIDHLAQQIGGKRGGSSGKIWTFSASGYNLLKLGNTKLKAGRKRLYEPTSILFLEHMLAINESYTKLLELDRQKKIELLEVQHEPRCWRTFSERGISFYLKPDLFASLVPAHEREFETVYFLEIDRATEAPIKVIKKCKQYINYFNSGIEQRQNGVFPFVVWITPNEKRCEQLTRYIHENLPKAEMLFRVIPIKEFDTLIRGMKKQQEDE